MSAQNTLANKAIRRAVRTDHAERMAKKRGLQARIAEMTLNEPGWLTAADGPIMAEEIPNNATGSEEEA